MDLGEKRENNANKMYPTSVKEEEDKIEYRTISLPMKLFGDLKIKKGDKVKVTLEGEITGIHDDEYSSCVNIEAKEGEVLEGGEEAKAGETEGTLLSKEGK